MDGTGARAVERVGTRAVRLATPVGSQALTRRRGDDRGGRLLCGNLRPLQRSPGGRHGRERTVDHEARAQTADARGDTGDQSRAHQRGLLARGPRGRHLHRRRPARKRLSRIRPEGGDLQPSHHARREPGGCRHVELVPGLRGVKGEQHAGGDRAGGQLRPVRSRRLRRHERGLHRSRHRSVPSDQFMRQRVWDEPVHGGGHEGFTRVRAVKALRGVQQGELQGGGVQGLGDVGRRGEW